jgi:hypothetical protein
MSETAMVLEDLVREGARKMLQAALEAEIAEHLAKYHSFKREFLTQFCYNLFL